MSAFSSSNRTLEASVENVVPDKKRLRALRRYNILDTDPEPAFDRISRLAAHLFEAPMALVNFVGADRQWFKSSVGLEEVGGVEQNETGLDVSFCVYTVKKGEVFVVDDLSEDERFADNPYVLDHGVRFYAGAPLITPDNRRIGTLCVLDTEPRSPNEETLDRLGDLAAMVVDELELRRERSEHEQSRELLRQAQELANVGGWEYDPEDDTLNWTDETYRIHELPTDADIDVESAIEFYVPDDRHVIEAHVETLLEDGGQYDLELDLETAEGNQRRIRTVGQAQREGDETTQITGVIQDITEQHRDRRLMEVQSAYFEWIATGAPIDAVLQEIAQFTEEQLSDAAVSVLRFEDGRLHHATGPSLPDRFIEAIDGVEIGPEVGTCGTAVYNRQEVVTEDIRDDERWDGYREAAERAGFRSCNSQVIQGSDGTVFGTFAIYRGEPGSLGPAARQLVKRMSHVASVAMEREQRERDLRESEERWRQLVDRHPGPIHVSIDGEYAYANEATAELLGVDSVEDLIGREMTDFIPPEDRELSRRRGEKVYQKKEEVELVETQIQRPDGTERTVLVRSVPIQYDGKNAAQTMMWDVTERREAEQELRRSEKKFRTVVENAQPVTFMIDREGTFLLSEGEDLQTLGLEPGEIVGESVFDVYANTPGVIEGLQRALDGEHVDHEVEVEGRVFDSWYSPFYDDAGDVAGVIGMAADITERREAQLELRKQKEVLQTLFDNVPVMIMLVEDGEIEMVNDHVEDVLGWSEETLDRSTELMERCYPDPETRRRVLDNIEEAPDEWRDFQPKCKDGDRVDTTWKNVHLPDGRTIGIGMDISERKARERDLRDSNRRLRLALEAANAGTFEYDLETDQVMWDERSLGLYGLDLDPEKQDANLLDEIVLEEDLDHLDEVFDQAVEEERPYEVSYRIHRADDGELRHIRSHGLILRNRDGTPERVVGINQDVTERKEREKQLRLLEAAVENSPATVLITEAGRLDEPGPKTVYANPAVEALTGYDREEIIGQSPRMLQGPDTDRAALDRIRAALENNDPVREVLRNYTKDGTPYWNDLYIAPVQDKSGTVTHFVSIQEDVTERRRRKQRLERQNDLFAKAQDIADVGAWEYDVRSDELTVTDELKRIHGLSPDAEMTIDRGVSFYHPDDRQTLRQALTDAIESGDPYDLKLRLITPDGDQRWAHGRAEPQIEDGEVVRVRGSIQDITDQKRAKESLRQSEELHRTTLGSITDAVFLTKEDGTLTYVCPNVDYIFDYSEEEARSLGNIAALLGSDPGSGHDFDEDGRLKNVECRIESAKGKQRDLLVNVRQVSIQGATRMYTCRDVTERKKAEIALRQSRERYRSLFRDSNDAILVHDLNGTIQEVNPTAESLFGYGMEEMEGQSLDDLHPPSETETARQKLDSLQHDSDFEGVSRYARADDSIFWGEIAANTVDIDGKTVARTLIRDVTEREESRRKLERYREYTDRLLNAIDDLFFAIDEEAQMKRWNDRIPEVTGYTDEELEALTSFDLVPESEHERVEARISEALSGGGAHIEVPLVRKDGTTIPYEFAGSLVETPEGEVQIVGIGRDIAARKERERQLRQAETFFQHAQDALFLIDVEREGGEPAFAIQRVNPAYESQTGFSKEDLRGATPQAVLGEEAAQHTEAKYRRCMDRREPLEYEEELLLDGTTTYRRTRIAPVVVDGEVQQIVGSTRDVTERKRREEALERQNDLFEKAQEMANVGAGEYNVQTGEGMVTDQIKRIHGLSADDELTPERSISFYHPDDQATIREAFTRAVEEAEPYDLELRIITDDGEQRWVQTQGKPQSEDGDVIRVRGATQDVTERVRRRKELEEAKDRAEEANRIKSALLSNMNHEFRTPLTSIISFSEVLRKEPELAEKFAGRILGGGKRLLHTLNTVMDFAELEAESLSKTPKHVDLGTLAQSVLTAFSHQIERDGVSVQVREPDGVVTAFLDEHLVERVLSHLVSNAVKFTEEGSVTVTVTGDGEAVTLRVSDTGVGIDPDFLPQAYDQFAQASSGYDRTHEGNGLGLTIVKRMVDQMEGDVSIESTPGDGTEVSVRLPIHDQPEEAGTSVELGA